MHRSSKSLNNQDSGKANGSGFEFFFNEALCTRVDQQCEYMTPPRPHLYVVV